MRSQTEVEEEMSQGGTIAICSKPAGTDNSRKGGKVHVQVPDCLRPGNHDCDCVNFGSRSPASVN